MNVSSGVMNTSDCRLFQLRFEEDLGKLPRFLAQRIGVGDWAEQPCSALCSSEDVCHFPTSSPTCFFGFARDSPLEQAGFEPSVPARTAVACPPISLDSSSTKTTSGVRASRARFGQLADQRIALRYRWARRSFPLGFEKPSNFRIKLTFSIFYVYGPHLLAAFVLVRVDFPPTQPSL